MGTNKIDSFFRKSINESEDFYETEANVAKERIWKQVQHRKKKLVIPLFFRLLAAACVLLLISTSILFVSNLKSQKRIEALAKSNTDLKNKVELNTKNELIQNESLIAANIITHDTVFIEKQVVVTKPIVLKERITDTVYIQQIEYNEKEISPESIMAIENNIPADSTYEITTDAYETKILISNTAAFKKEKRKKIQFKFGGNQSPGNDGAIALSSKLQN